MENTIFVEWFDIFWFHPCYRGTIPNNLKQFLKKNGSKFESLKLSVNKLDHSFFDKLDDNNKNVFLKAIADDLYNIAQLTEKNIVFENRLHVHYIDIFTILVDFFDIYGGEFLFKNFLIELSYKDDEDDDKEDIKEFVEKLSEDNKKKALDFLQDDFNNAVHDT